MLVCEPCQRENGVIDTFARDSTAKAEQQRLVWRKPECLAGKAFCDRPEFRGIEAAGNDRNFGRVSPVQGQQIRFILWTLGDDAIGIVYNAVFNIDAICWKLGGFALAQPPHAP